MHSSSSLLRRSIVSSFVSRVSSQHCLAICVDNYAVVIELNKNKDKAKFITAYVADGTNGKGEKAIDLIRSSEKW